MSELPWVEKYRPKTLDHVVGNKPVVERFKVLAGSGNIPNMILSGPPGCGKTTSLHCLARALLGNRFKDALLELNASDDRNIDVVRSKIKSFAQRTVSLPSNLHKIVLLDEADSMTGSAQQALRRTMEIHSDTTRFVFACNLSDKIIEPIQSRCCVIRFQVLTDVDILERLMYIIEKENVQYDDSGLEALIFTSEGDMRDAINNLQSVHQGFKIVLEENVFKICDSPQPRVLNKVVDALLENRLRDAITHTKGLWDDGFCGLDILSTLFRVITRYECDERQKLCLLREFGVTQLRVSEGLDTFIQISGMLSRMCSKLVEIGK